MNALPLLSELADRGVRIRVDGRHLAVSPDRLTDSLATKIQDNKPALIADLEKLRQYATDDDEWQEIISDPAQFEAYISSVAVVEQRQHGEIPNHYTATVHCETCNQNVPHFPVDGDTVGACVWCLNNQPVPTSTSV